MRSEFENSIKWSSSYEKLVYQHGERLFIFDDGKYKIAAVQLAWEIFKEKQAEVDALILVMEGLLEEMKYPTATFEEVICSGVKELEQALKGGGDV